MTPRDEVVARLVAILGTATNGDDAMTLTAVLIPAPEGGFVALNPETGTTTQGETIAQALANLREATELYLEEFPLGGARPARLNAGVESLGPAR